MPGIGENQSVVSKKPLDISDKRVYVGKESEKNIKIIEALKALEGIKRTLLGVLKT